MNWKEAYLRQAESDYHMFEYFNKNGKPLCQQLHYLQMTTEKLAKSFLCNVHNAPPKKTHFVLTKFMRQSVGIPHIRKAMGFKQHNHAAYLAYITSLLDIAQKVENLAPVGGNLDKLNPEYPWTDSSGNVVAPVDFDFADIMHNRNDIIKFKGFLSSLLRIAKTI